MRNGWELKKLGEVCEFYNGQAHEKNIDDKGKYILINSKFISSDATSYKRTNDLLFPLHQGDVVMVMSDVPNGKALVKCFLVEKNNTYTLNQRICAIRTRNFDAKFLQYQLNRNKFLLKFNNGENQTNLRKDDILNCPLLVPPLPEQQRIVSILDEAFAAIAKAKANTERNLLNARELFESYLQSVFYNPGEDWIKNRLSEITTKIGSGATPRGGNESYKTEGISLVRSMKVHDFGFKQKNLAFIDAQQAKELNNVTLQEGDVLLNITGASVARCCIIPKEYLPARVNQHVSIIRAKKEVIDPVFLKLLLTSKFYKDQLLLTGEQGATRQAITKAQLEVFNVAFPKSLKTQQAIIQKLNTLSKATQKLEGTYQQKLNSLEELKKSILQKAFNGELKTREEVMV